MGAFGLGIYVRPGETTGRDRPTCGDGAAVVRQPLFGPVGFATLSRIASHQERVS